MRTFRFILAGAIVLGFAVGSVGATQPPVEVAPPPHPAFPPVAVVPVKGGYQLFLNRATTELLSDALESNADEKEIARTLREKAKEKKEGANPDPDGAAKLEMIAFLVSTQLPGFKKALRENMGPAGVVVTVTGLQAPTVKFARPRPRLERGLEIARGVMPLLPDDARDVMEALRAVARTTPLVWKVEPRE